MSMSRTHDRPGGVRLVTLLAGAVFILMVTTGAEVGAVPAPRPPVQSGEPLKGLFRVDPANCESAAPAGSYFRMIQPGGDASGPFVENVDSSCPDKTFTNLAPGRDGGLSTVDYQPHPDPPFDAQGNGTSDRITQPQNFFGVKFAAATNPVDPQTGTDVAVPVVVHDGAGKLSGDVRAFAAGYNRQHFNQGSPKPDGSNPGLTSGPVGTFDPVTKRYTLEWTSTIVGGAFNNFSGRWHFEGTFEPAAAAS